MLAKLAVNSWPQVICPPWPPQSAGITSMSHCAWPVIYSLMDLFSRRNLVCVWTNLIFYSVSEWVFFCNLMYITAFLGFEDENNIKLHTGKSCCPPLLCAPFWSNHIFCFLVYLCILASQVQTNMSVYSYCLLFKKTIDSILFTLCDSTPWLFSVNSAF